MEGAEVTLERLEYVTRAVQHGRTSDHVFAAHLGDVPREDLVPYVADFLLQLEDIQWSLVAGVTRDTLVISLRNLGYSRNAGEFVKACFSDIGNAGGHRAMAKAVIPTGAFRKKFGSLREEHVSTLLNDLATQFLGDGTPPGRRRDTAPEGRGEPRSATSRPPQSRRPGSSSSRQTK
jgi:nanoRNase/pAp phosphatase (c-di-AMP/oligoRNAs hydrolase)